METPTYMEPAPYETALLDPRKLHFFYSSTGVLRLTIADRICYLRVKLLRTFPLSDGDTLISVRDALDDWEKEIGLINDMAELDPSSKNIAVQELNRYYFVPRIRTIKSVDKEFGFFYWSVDTDRGPRTFPMRDSHDSVIEVSERRIVLTDADGARFEITDIDALDKKSRELIRKNLYI